MSKLGLLGALQGLGQGITGLGTDIVRRREQALENARKLAEEQRKRGYQVEDREDTQGHETELTTTREAAATKRSEDERAFRRSERIESQSYESGEHAKDRDFKASEGAKERSARRDLEVLKSSLEGSKSSAEIKLRNQLEGDDVQSVQYGAPDAHGYGEVFVVTKNGQMRSTGTRALVPKRFGPDDEDTSTHY